VTVGRGRVEGNRAGQAFFPAGRQRMLPLCEVCCGRRGNSRAVAAALRMRSPAATPVFRAPRFRVDTLQVEQGQAGLDCALGERLAAPNCCLKTASRATVASWLVFPEEGRSNAAQENGEGSGLQSKQLLRFRGPLQSRWPGKVQSVRRWADQTRDSPWARARCKVGVALKIGPADAL